MISRIKNIFFFISSVCLLPCTVRNKKIGMMFLLCLVGQSAFAAGPLVNTVTNLQVIPCTPVKFMSIPVQLVEGNIASRAGMMGASVTAIPAPGSDGSGTVHIPGCPAVQRYYAKNIPGTQLWYFATGSGALSLNTSPAGTTDCITSFSIDRTSTCTSLSSEYGGVGWGRYVTLPGFYLGSGSVLTDISYYLVAEGTVSDVNNATFTMYAWANPVNTTTLQPNTPVTVTYSLKREPTCQIDMPDSTVNFPDIPVPAGGLQKVSVDQVTKTSVSCTGISGPETNIGLKFTALSPVGGQNATDTWGLTLDNPGFFIYGKQESTGVLTENLCTTSLTGRDNTWVNYAGDNYIPVGIYPRGTTSVRTFPAAIVWQLCYNPATATRTMGQMSAALSYDYTFY